MNPNFNNTKGVHVQVLELSVFILYLTGFKVLVDCNHSIWTNHFWRQLSFIWVESSDFIINLKQVCPFDNLLTNMLSSLFRGQVANIFQFRGNIISSGNVIWFNLPQTFRKILNVWLVSVHHLKGGEENVSVDARSCHQKCFGRCLIQLLAFS